jgi:hypothetical protein
MWNPPVYGAKTQHIEETEDNASLSQKDVNHQQQLGGTLLHYAIAVYPTLIMTVNVLTSEQTRATAETADKSYQIAQLLHNTSGCHTMLQCVVFFIKGS